MPHVSVVIPVFSEHEILPEIHRQLGAALKDITDDYEILLVDDRGREDCWAMIGELSRLDHRVKGLRLSRNFGQQAALMAGLDHCQGDWVVIMDADLEEPPATIAELYHKAQEGYDVVLARRRHELRPPTRRILTKVFFAMFRLMTGTTFQAGTAAMRIMSRQVVENLRAMKESARYLGMLVEWLGFKKAYVEIDMQERPYGRSGYTLLALALVGLKGLIAHSNRPLYASIVIGLGMAAVSFCYGLFILWSALYYGNRLPGWSSLMVALIFIGGLIIFNLGIIGLYIGHIFTEVKKRPLYVISQKIRP